MDRDTRQAATRWLEQRLPAVVVEVVQVRGSAPRCAGARMLVSGVQAVGTVGGGHLEWQALATARAMLAARDTQPLDAHYALGPTLGQCCGGAVDLRFSPLAADVLARWPLAPPLFHLQLHGGGHVGHAIATLLATLDVVVDWIDERDDAFAPTTPLGTPWPSTLRRLVAPGAEGEVALAPPHAFYLVLTHDHALDFRIAEAVLRRGDFGFLGLIGSKSKRQRFLHRFADRGLDEALLRRLHCPVGVAGIAGNQPEVIAMAVVAQLLQVASLPVPVDDRIDAPASGGVPGGQGGVSPIARRLRTIA